MANSELLPCPFCGGEHIDLYEGNYGNGVYCMSCGVMMGEPIHLEFRVSERVSMAQAIAAWNTRAELANGGTLKADQVREAWTGNLKRDCLYDPPTPDWQAIADELNAEIRDRMRELEVES